jgi:hypothetical protein
MRIEIYNMNYESLVYVTINNYKDYKIFLDNIILDNLLNYYLPLSSNDYKEIEKNWGCSSNMRYGEIINEDDIIEIDVDTLDDDTLNCYTLSNLKINFKFETSGNPPYLWYEYMKEQDFIKEIYYNIKQIDYCGITEKSLEFFHSNSENNRELIERKYEILLKIKFENDNNDIEEIIQKINKMKERNISRNMKISKEVIFYTGINRFIDIERKNKKIILYFRTNKINDVLFWSFDEIIQIEEFILDEMKKLNNKCSTKIIFKNKRNNIIL